MFVICCRFEWCQPYCSRSSRHGQTDVYHVNHTVICENGSDLLAIHAKTIRQCRKTHFARRVLFGLYRFICGQRGGALPHKWNTIYEQQIKCLLLSTGQKIGLFYTKIELIISLAYSLKMRNYIVNLTATEKCVERPAERRRKKNRSIFINKKYISFICLDHEYRGFRLAWIFTAHCVRARTECWHLANSSGFLMFTWLRLLHLLHFFPSQLLQSPTDMHCRFFFLRASESQQRHRVIEKKSAPAIENHFAGLHDANAFVSRQPQPSAASQKLQKILKFTRQAMALTHVTS